MKLIYLNDLLILTLSLLAGCNTKPKTRVVYKNVSYETSFDKQDKNVCLGQVKIKIVNEKIANVDFNYINAVPRELITDDDAHIKLMYAAKTIPAKDSKQLTDILIRYN